MDWVFAPSHEAVEQTTWRTYVVFGHTFWASLRILVHGVRTSLSADYVDAKVQRWTQHVFAVSRTGLGRTGHEVLGREACVLLSNHVSLLDIPAVCGTYPGRVRFVAKQELRKIPAFGAAMEASGVVFVDRGDRQRAIEQLEQAKQLLQVGTSLWVAAEGSRSRDGRLHAFKKGGFHVALGLGVPIVPTWIQGTLDVLPADQLASVTDQVVTVSYGTPIPTAGRTVVDLPELMAAVRTEMLRLAREAGASDDVDAVGG